MKQKQYDVIQDVKNFKSEIGILYVNEFNRKVLTKLFHECNLNFMNFLSAVFMCICGKDIPGQIGKKLNWKS